MLLFLELGRYLVSTANMAKVLEIVAKLFGLDWNIVKLTVKVPARRTLERSLVTLDMLSMHWSRGCWKNGYTMAASWQAADSSTQNHYDYFCQRCDSLVLPPAATDVELVEHNPALSFERTMLPLG
eukprot:8347563-Heterocapsa_arctica.AAC.1